MRRRGGLAGLVLAALAGCASPALPAYLVDPEANPAPECPPSRFVAAVGTSTAGREDAEARARAAVSRKVSSTLASQTERIVAASILDGTARSEQSLRQVIREEAGFHHAELIRIVGPVEVRGGESYALACLDRQAAVALVLADAEPAFRRFQGAVTRADDAAARSDRAVFAGAWRDLRAAWTEGLPFLAQCRALEGAPCAMEAAMQRDRTRMSGEAGRLRSGVTYALTVHPGDLPDGPRAAVESTFHRALSELGSTGPVDPTCTGKKASIWIEIEADANCGWGSLGHTCRPEYRMRATSCDAAARPALASLSGSDLSGADGRDPRKALARAVSALGVERAREFLRDGLSTLVPL